MTPGFDPAAPGAADAPAGALPLADAISSLRAELERAMATPAPDDDGLRLEAETVQLTVEVTATTSGTGRAGIRWWLLEAGGEASHERSATQSVTISFVPTIPGPDGERVAPAFLPFLAAGFTDTSDDTADEATAAPQDTAPTPLRQARDSWSG